MSSVRSVPILCIHNKSGSEKRNMGVSPMIAVHREFGRYFTTESGRAERSFCVETEDRFALAELTGIPVNRAEYHTHGRDAHGT
jgi:hypothetical protein